MSTDHAPHGVDTVYVRVAPGNHRTFKYGITKTGKQRPQRQLSQCRKVMAKLLEMPVRKVDCRWAWAREEVPGFLKARRIEAGYATHYKGAFGKCPPGMVRCL